MNHESRNLLRHCMHPVFVGRMILFLFKRIVYSLQYRYKRSVAQYPKAVREAFHLVIRHPDPEPREWEGSRANAGNPTFVGDSSAASLPQNDEYMKRLKLVVGHLEYNDEPDWHKEFHDPEQTMSLHRWGWLLYQDMAVEQGFLLMRSWLRTMGSLPKGIASTPYTTGERIVNALIFCTRKQIDVPQDLRSALIAMALHVAKKIEYHGVRGTGNHVVNNARALYFAGQTLGMQALATLAFEVLHDALPWLVTRDGFLREESSHYHLLFTQWLLEIYDRAKTAHDTQMKIYLEPYIQMCAEQCWFFFVEGNNGAWQVPFIGDVSPDCTPEWLVQYLRSLLLPYKPDQWPMRGMKAFSGSGWFRFDDGRATLFWHVPQEQMIHRATHGHGDVCSFVLFLDGMPVLIDPGRPTYTIDDPLYAYSGSARAHNTLTIDGLDPFLYDRVQHFPAFYQKRKVDVNWKQEEGQFVFSVSHTGFRRMKGDRIDHTRRFYLHSDFLEVEDALHGTRSHLVETFFHQAPGIRLSCTTNGTSGITVEDWIFPEYGTMIPSSTIVMHERVKLPVKNSYRFALHDGI